MPIFLRSVPERNPRTECGCQPVAFISSLAVAPPDRFSRSIILAALLPSRAESDFFAPLRGWGAFLAEVVFFPAFPFLGATCANRGAFGGFRLGRIGRFRLFCDARHGFSLRGGYRVDDIDHSVRARLQGDSANVWAVLRRCQMRVDEGR